MSFHDNDSGDGTGGGFSYTDYNPKGKFVKWLARKWGFSANGDSPTDNDTDPTLPENFRPLQSYSLKNEDVLNSDLSKLKEYIDTVTSTKAEYEDKKPGYVKSNKVWEVFSIAPYWGSVSEEEAEAYAKANEEFADASAVDDAFTREDKDSEFRAAYDAYVKASTEKAKADLRQKALELVEAQTWTGATADADIQTWHSSAAIRDAYLKTAFSYLTDAQLLEIKTDSEAAKATVGQKPVEEFVKLTTTLKAENDEIGAGGNLAETVSGWSDARAKEDQADWIKIKTQEATAREKANTEGTLSRDAYVKAAVNPFDVAAIDKALTLYEARIKNADDQKHSIEELKDAIDKDATRVAVLKSSIPSGHQFTKSKELDLPTAKQTYNATLNASFSRIKKRILEAIEKNKYECDLHHIHEHEAEALLIRGYSIEVIEDTSKTSPDKQDKDNTVNYRLSWNNQKLHKDISDKENSWFKTFDQKEEAAKS